MFQVLAALCEKKTRPLSKSSLQTNGLSRINVTFPHVSLCMSKQFQLWEDTPQICCLRCNKYCTWFHFPLFYQISYVDTIICKVRLCCRDYCQIEEVTSCGNRCLKRSRARCVHTSLSRSEVNMRLLCFLFSSPGFQLR